MAGRVTVRGGVRVLRVLRTYSDSLGIVLLGAVGWGLLARLDLFERFHAFSRTHEQWGLDEAVAFLVAAALVMPVLLWRSNRRLNTALARKSLAEAQARRIADHDILTGLPNRRRLRTLLAGAIAQGPERTALLMLDLDRFKPVNDRFGHEAGDRVLAGVADRLRRIAGEGVTPVRIGGDEFAVLLAGHAAPEARALDLGTRIVSALAEPFRFREGAMALGGSVGVAVGAAGMTAEEMLRRADQAMYRAKAEGRGRVAMFNDAMDAAQREAIALEIDLRAALAADRIYPKFQPVVDLASKRIIGFEILARWTREGVGPCAASEFVPLAERIGLIDEIGRQVLGKVAGTSLARRADMRFGLNLSTRELGDPRAVPRILAVVKTLGIYGSQVVIEITEAGVVSDLDAATALIRELRATGIRAVLDDFGTGHSSLSLLGRLPLDGLKLDRSLIAGIDRNPANAKIVRCVVALACSLDLMVTAKGIERPEECDLLREMGCPFGQGFLLGEPMEDEEAMDRLWRQDAVADLAVPEDRSRLRAG